MKSIKNHLSLIVALFSIVFTLQTYMVMNRVVVAYEDNLNKNYQIIVVTKKEINPNKLEALSDDIKSATELSTKALIKNLQSQIKQRHIDLLKLSLPHFYALKLKHYPSPKQIKSIHKKLDRASYITRIEDFSNSHDALYKLLLLFKSVMTLFAGAILAVTLLLILKEMRIWQFQHNERMSIMAMFGAPVWMRSAVLFRLSFVDAIIAGLLAIATFIYIDFLNLGREQLESIGITISLFNPLNDGLMIMGTALGFSVLLSTLIVIGHKEEV